MQLHYNLLIDQSNNILQYKPNTHLHREQDSLAGLLGRGDLIYMKWMVNDDIWSLKHQQKKKKTCYLLQYEIVMKKLHELLTNSNTASFSQAQSLQKLTFLPENT